MDKATQIKYAQLHNSFFVPGVGNMPATLEKNSATSKVLAMELSNGFLKITASDRAKGIKGTVLVPITNVLTMVEGE